MKSNFSILALSLFLMFACKQEVKKEDSIEITKAEVIQKSETKLLQNKEQENNANCFIQKDIDNLNLFFKSISNKDSSTPLAASVDSSNLRFEEEGLKELTELLSRESFDSFELKNDKSNCDDDLGLSIYYREKYDDGDEIHYSEIARMYQITKVDGIVKLKFLATAG